MPHDRPTAPRAGPPTRPNIKPAMKLTRPCSRPDAKRGCKREKNTANRCTPTSASCSAATRSPELRGLSRSVGQHGRTAADDRTRPHHATALDLHLRRSNRHGDHAARRARRPLSGRRRGQVHDRRHEAGLRYLRKSHLPTGSGDDHRKASANRRWLVHVHRVAADRRSRSDGRIRDDRQEHRQHAADARRAERPALRSGHDHRRSRRHPTGARRFGDLHMHAPARLHRSGDRHLHEHRERHRYPGRRRLAGDQRIEHRHRGSARRPGASSTACRKNP